MNGEQENQQCQGTPRKKAGIGAMDIILIIIGVVLLAFTVAMIWIFQKYGAVPDTLITCVFAALGGECGVMGWIQTTKTRYRERQWQIDDQKAQAIPTETEENKNA